MPGSTQMGHLAQFAQSLPWWDFVPAPGVLASQPGQKEPSQFIAAAQTRDKAHALVYLPRGGTVQLKSAELPRASSLKARWFDPRTGRDQPATRETATATTTTTTTTFRAPDDQDWLLVLATP